mmetsp:Transcript_14604/g.24917  ORF Transcript_14604/g.24917 Transcript_14604/m.24917 type:complete len:200 (-) Transcript_14604:235-834(-)
MMSLHAAAFHGLGAVGLAVAGVGVAAYALTALKRSDKDLLNAQVAADWIWITCGQLGSLKASPSNPIKVPAQYYLSYASSGLKNCLRFTLGSSQSECCSSEEKFPFEFIAEVDDASWELMSESLRAAFERGESLKIDAVSKKIEDPNLLDPLEPDDFNEAEWVIISWKTPPAESKAPESSSTNAGALTEAPVTPIVTSP